MRATCDKFKGLRVSFAGGSIKFVDGAAEVDEAQADHLLRLPDHYGVAVESGSKPAEVSPEDNVNTESDASDDSDDVPEQAVDSEESAEAEDALAEPKGNASVEEWRAYAVQQGQDADAVAELKREEIKALLEG